MFSVSNSYIECGSLSMVSEQFILSQLGLRLGAKYIGQPMWHFITCSPMEGHPRGNFTEFSRLEEHLSHVLAQGIWDSLYCIEFFPLKGHPRGHFTLLTLMEGHCRWHLSCFSYHWGNQEDQSHPSSVQCSPF